MSAIKAPFECRVEYNYDDTQADITETPASWTRITTAREHSIARKVERASLDSRDSAFHVSRPSYASQTPSFDIYHDPASQVWQDFNEAFANRRWIWIRVMDGAFTAPVEEPETAGSGCGMAAPFYILDFTEGQPLNDAGTNTVTLRLAGTPVEITDGEYD